MNILPYQKKQHQIIKIMKMEEAQHIFEDVDDSTLVVFDIDSTLTTPSDPYLRRQAIRQHKDIFNTFVTPLTKNQTRLFHHILVLQSPSILIEEETPHIINALYQRGAKVLAFTASKTGSVEGWVKSFPQWRYNELKRLNIDFSKAYKGKILFYNLSDYGNDYPGLEDGVVYCGHKLEKGLLLKAVLDELQWRPNKIIVIDDKLKNIESFLNHLPKENIFIDFIGIHYEGMERFSSPPINALLFKEKISYLVHETKKICKS